MSVLPENYETEPDKDGIITRVEYQFDEKNNLVKITRKIKINKHTLKVFKSSIDRKNNWTPFGLALNSNNLSVTTISDVDVFMEDPRKEKKEEKKLHLDLKKCRVCGDDTHWTLICPVKNKIKEEPEKTNEFIKKENLDIEIKKDCTLVLSNIPPELNECDIREIYSSTNEHIKNLILVRDRNTSISRGFGFITFNSVEATENVLKKLQNYKCY